MILIFEGVDKAGKTTLIQNVTKLLLKKKISVFIHKNTIKPGKNLNEYGRVVTRARMEGIYLGYYQALSALPQNEVHILDRGHVTEQIYGKVKRRYTPGREKLIESYFDKMEKTMIIYCTADKKVIAARFKADKEDLTKVSEIETIKENYQSFFKKRPRLHYFEADSSTTSSEDNAKYIINLLTTKQWI